MSDRDISHWTDWSDEDLVDQAAGACQHPALIDDKIVRDAIAMNCIAPFRQRIAKLEAENLHLRDMLRRVGEVELSKLIIAALEQGE